MYSPVRAMIHSLKSSILFPVWGDYEWAGCDGPEDVRSKHDTFKKFMLVDTQNPFPCAGNVAKVKIVTGSNSDRPWSDDRGLKVGYFRLGNETKAFVNHIPI